MRTVMWSVGRPDPSVAGYATVLLEFATGNGNPKTV
jgi:hypothetical protein